MLNYSESQVKILYTHLPDEDFTKKLIELYVNKDISLHTLNTIPKFIELCQVKAELYNTIICKYEEIHHRHIVETYWSLIDDTVDKLKKISHEEMLVKSSKSQLIKYATVRLKNNSGLSTYPKTISIDTIADIASEIYQDNNKAENLKLTIIKLFSDIDLYDDTDIYHVSVVIWSNKQLALKILHDNKSYKNSSWYHVYLNIPYQDIPLVVSNIWYLDDWVENVIKMPY